ncbi:uncharacterized protein LOC136061607 [Quercus suber]|uniref:uncharacterized protein LOC136061607 n=1 Tax=Quercus suber TaxID=58331 RepID=UPI0032DF9AF5
MESYRRFNQQELFMSLKRDLAMITQQVYVAEGLNKDSWVKAQAATQSRLEAEASLGRLKEEHSKMSEELKEVKYLQIAKKSKTDNPYRWVRYVTQANSYVARL